MNVPASVMAEYLYETMFCMSVLSLICSVMLGIKITGWLWVPFFLAQMMFTCTSLICSAIEGKQ